MYNLVARFLVASDAQQVDISIPSAVSEPGKNLEDNVGEIQEETKIEKHGEGK